MPQPLVFVSYSHKDEAEKERLIDHLGVLPSDSLAIWSDDRIGAGADWEREINKSLGQAKVAILLITANYLNSKFILEKEVKTLLERREKDGVEIFPVIAKSCAWTKVAWLSGMIVRPRNGVPVWGGGGTHVDEDLAAVAEEVSDILDRVRANDGQSPPPVEPEPPKEPRADDEETRAQKRTPKQPRPRKLLIVDDNPLFRKAVRFDLRDMNVSLEEAELVRDGIQMLRDDREIRVVLLDLNFPTGEDGTALLDFTRERPSYYRVIVMTDYEELFLAEKATTYDDVLYYLSKANGAAPRQMLRFAVTRALDDLKREEAVKFSESMLKNYPAPFIHIYQQVRSDMKPLEKLVTQKDILELLVHFSALVILCEYLNSGARTQDLDTQIRKRMTRPALGDWINIINEVAKRANHLPEMPFLDSFLTFYSGKNKKILNDFISLRNKYIGHGTRHTDSEYLEIVKMFDEWIETLLQDYQFITQFLLCYVMSVQIIRGKHIYSLKECVGSNPQLLNSTRPFGVLLNANEMHVVNMKAEESLSLYPFMILADCPECRQLEIFFYSKFSNDDLHYLSYTTGHWLIKKETAKDFLELIEEAPA
jgi:CheY-like chemotaxis protein